MAKYGLTLAEEKEVVRLYATGKHTQAELASQFVVAPVTIRRALAEQGVIELVAYKTRNETELLKHLKEQYGVTSITALENLFDAQSVA